MTDNVAVLKGFTKPVRITLADTRSIMALVKPDTSFGDNWFDLWDMDEQDFYSVRGWTCQVEELTDIKPA